MDSFPARVFIAVALTVGFYLLAFGVAAGLVAMAVFAWIETGRIHARLTLWAVSGAALILWSVVPRPDRVPDPGPELLPDRAPRLFDLIRSIAAATGQSVPSHVFLVPDVNAFVATRGGWMGIGAHRIMGLGLPLLQTLTASQLRAVLAHEFGHFHGGDVRLGPWIHRTRATIQRTIENLSTQRSWTHAPFQWYARLFLRVTHALSRQQELAADRLAAQVGSGDCLAAALMRTSGATAAYGAYWRDELVPTLKAGYLPPIARGFAEFLQAPSVARSVAAFVDRDLEAAKASPYDTHPSTRERIEALGVSGISTTPDPEQERAIDLISDLPAWERKLLASLSDQAQAESLESIDWQAVPEAVWLPLWRARAEWGGLFLVGWTLPALGEKVRSLLSGAGALDSLAGQRLDTGQRIRLAGDVLGSALCVVLSDRGWMLHAPVGQSVTLTMEHREIEPFALVARMAGGELSDDAWGAFCEATGLESLDLGDALGATPRALPPPPPVPEEPETSPALRRGHLWTLGVPAVVYLLSFATWAAAFRFKPLAAAPVYAIGVPASLLLSWLYGDRVVGLRDRARLGLIESQRQLIGWFTAYAFAPLFLVCALVVFANGAADSSPVRSTRGRVVSTSVSGTETAWYAQVSYGRGSAKLKISQDDYHRLQPGSSEVILHTRGGRLGMEWLVRLELLP